MKTRIMTVDLEPEPNTQECKSMSSVIPKLLNFFDDEKIKATFFTVTSLLEKHEDQIKEIAKKHEIASHSHTHATLNPVNASWEMEKSKQTLKEYDIKCKGFRAPRFITTKDHFELLKKHGYTYDASMARFFPKRYKNFGMPNKPYTKQNIHVFPMSNFVWPAVNSGLSYLKLLHPVSKIFPKPYMFYLHPWEFIEQQETKNIIGSLLKRNSGKKAIKIFKDYIQHSNSKWINCANWIEKNHIKN